eukprot:694181-Rhodomonas_salina.1
MKSRGMEFKREEDGAHEVEVKREENSENVVNFARIAMENYGKENDSGMGNDVEEEKKEAAANAISRWWNARKDGGARTSKILEDFFES